MSQCFVGKTSTIAFVARLLVAQGKRVLITSYTHSAVDNVLLKLMESGMVSDGTVDPCPSVLRIGPKESCHSGVHSILATNVAAKYEAGQAIGSFERQVMSTESLRHTISSARVVGATALTVPRSLLLVDQDFDVVIVDEAGQISQPAVLGAVMAADKFVLVGDHKQLQPLARSELSEKGGES